MDGAEQLFAWWMSVIVFAFLAYFLHRFRRPLLSSMCASAIVGVSLGFLIGGFLGELHFPIRHWLYAERVGSPAARDLLSHWIGRTAHFSPSIGMITGVVVAMFVAHARRPTLKGP